MVSPFPEKKKAVLETTTCPFSILIHFVCFWVPNDPKLSQICENLGGTPVLLQACFSEKKHGGPGKHDMSILHLNSKCVISDPKWP